MVLISNPLIEATLSCDSKIVEHHLQNRSLDDSELQEAFLFSCTRPECFAITQLYINFGVYINIQQPVLLRSPLMLAAAANNYVIVRFLVNKNVDIHMKDVIGRTALHFAALSGSVAIIRSLVSAGASLNAQDNSGYSPLMVAVEYNRERAVALLISLGSDPTLKSRLGYDALSINNWYGYAFGPMLTVLPLSQLQHPAQVSGVSGQSNAISATNSRVNPLIAQDITTNSAKKQDTGNVSDHFPSSGFSTPFHSHSKSPSVNQ